MRFLPARRAAALAIAIVMPGAPAAEPSAQRMPAPAAVAEDPASLVDITRATIVTPANLSLPERTAVRVLVEEVARRTTVRMPVATQWPAASVPAIAVGPLATASTWAGAGLRGAASAATPGREGYRVALNPSGRSAPTVLVLGADTRGMLFGVGRLLRELRLERRSVRRRIPDRVRAAAVPWSACDRAAGTGAAFRGRRGQEAWQFSLFIRQQRNYTARPRPEQAQH